MTGGRDYSPFAEPKNVALGGFAVDLGVGEAVLSHQSTGSHRHRTGPGSLLPPAPANLESSHARS